jgi:photosystem II stability/assembly factor-like uncharacterized protein
MSQRFCVRKLACVTTVFFSTFAFLIPSLSYAQDNETNKTNDSRLAGLKFRQIGPFRGGRSGAVAGSQSEPLTYYMGATGGGIFKTVDGGIHWLPVSDGQIKLGSVGAIAVADSDSNIVYAGMGESDMRGNSSHGDGVYKSTDAGKTWVHVGLEDTQQIGALRIDSRNPDIAYVAAMGHMAGPNETRGVFRTRDGGKTWKKILYKNDHVGAIDVVIDPNNSNNLYAALYQFIRKPWTFESGGPESGIYKSTDGGDTWKEITQNPGMPKGLIGRVAIAVSPVKEGGVWMNIEAREGGVYHSDNGGDTWVQANGEHKIRQRAWYYPRIFADPKNPDVIYATNFNFFKSTDGGHTFKEIPTPHGDNHCLWISNNDPNRMIESSDGGAIISFNGGASWSSVMNQPTGQFYRVALDQNFPYNIYGAQQDNTTVEIASRGRSGAITESDWHDVGGGESGWIAPDPTNSRFVYAGSYDGLLTRYDNLTDSLTNVTVWPDNPMGSGAEAMKYRFQWNFPLLFSPHDPKLLYAGSNVLMGTRDEGKHWAVMSPDLTRNDKSKQGPVGGPIAKDNTGVEYYDTIFTIDESPVAKGLIWTGSDDGLIHLTRDSGKTWSNVTPKEFPDFIRVNCIAASPFDAGTAYVAATMYLSDDFRPFLYKTEDYGETWTKIVTGIPADDFTRTIRPDPNSKGLLFAGTEAHLYISYNDGNTWSPFQLNLPNVPITDIAFQKREDDMVIATQGRGFYVLNDLSLVRELTPDKTQQGEVHLFTPKDAYRYVGAGGGAGAPAGTGTNPPNGVVVYYSLKSNADSEVKLRFLNASGKLVKEFSSNESSKHVAPAGEGEERTPPVHLPVRAGLNRFVWDMRYSDATTFPGLILWATTLRGPLVTPGTYTVELVANGQTAKRKFVIKKDPRASTTPEDFAKQLELELQIRDKISVANQTILDIRNEKHEFASYLSGGRQEIASEANRISTSLSAVEDAIYQTKLQSTKDPLNYPIKLNNKLASLLTTVSASDSSPTSQSYEVYKEFSAQLRVQLDKLGQINHHDIEGFNKLLRDSNMPGITINSAKAL